jgi:hypothetical protein
MTTQQRLNALCACTTDATILNALHACRPGHPLGRDNAWKWRNAWTLVKQRPLAFEWPDLEWLERQACSEPVQLTGSATTRED